MSSEDVALYKRFTGLKSLYPDLETWISIGGWSMNDPDQPTATTFSDLAASANFLALSSHFWRRMDSTVSILTGQFDMYFLIFNLFFEPAFCLPF